MNASIQGHSFECYAKRAESESVSFHESLMVCGTCGAQIDMDKFTPYAACPICASGNVALEKRASGVLPDGLIPFEIGKPQALSRLSKWSKRRWFAPSRLKEACREEKLEGVYLPFWVFDAQAHVRYVGCGGRWREESSDRLVTPIDWSPVSGSVSVFYEDISVCAAGPKVQEVIERIKPYGVEKKAIPYAGEYLRGLSAARCAADERESFEAAKGQIKDDLNERALRDILSKGYDRADVISVEVSFSGVRYRQLLLPAWLCAFTVGDRRYLYAVNGETGKAGGPRIRSVPKLIALAAAAVLLVGLLITAAFYSPAPSPMPISAKVKTTSNISGR